MKPLFLFASCAALTLTACHAPSGHNSIPLTATALYNSDSVRLAMDGGDEKAADKKLTEAIDRYRKNKDTVGSIPLFKDAILLKPTARGYFELSGVLLANGGYQEAIKALGIAEKLGYTPLANVMFRYSYAYSSLMDSNEQSRTTDNSNSAIRYMQLALQMGYAHPEEFLRKEYFPYLNDHFDFTKAFNDVLSGTAGRNPEKSLWESYLTQFPEVPLPLVVNMEWIRAHPLKDDISYLFENFIPDMRNNRFERLPCSLERLSKGNLYVLHSYGGLAERLVGHCKLPIVLSSEYRASKVSMRGRRPSGHLPGFERLFRQARTTATLSQMSRSWFSRSATPDAVNQPSRNVTA